MSPSSRSAHLPLLYFLLATATALVPFTARADAAAESMTAATHAGFAAKSPTLATVDMHLHHAINCLVGPKGDGFDATQLNPCANSGNGAIPDETDSVRKTALEAALAEAEHGLAATDLVSAQASARKTESMLRALK